MQWCFLLKYIGEIVMKLQFYQKNILLIFPNIRLFDFVHTCQSQEDYFLNYTGFVVNYEEVQYVPVLIFNSINIIL